VRAASWSPRSAPELADPAWKEYQAEVRLLYDAARKEKEEEEARRLTDESGWIVMPVRAA